MPIINYITIIVLIISAMKLFFSIVDLNSEEYRRSSQELFNAFMDGIYSILILIITIKFIGDMS